MGSRSTKVAWPDVDLRGKTAIVTGANTGLGYETAKHLAMMGAHVILACRSENKAKSAVLRIQADHLEARGSHRLPYEPVDEISVEYMKLDLQHLQSVVEFATSYKEKQYPLHLLVCNAGVAFTPKCLTDDNFELQFQVNYLGHFLLTIHLLPVMRKSGEDIRVINVSSARHYDGQVKTLNMQAQRSYNRRKFYGNSKLFQIMSTYSFQHRLADSDISLFSLHPGYLNTGIYQNSTDSKLLSTFTSLGNITGYIKSDLTHGAATIISCAVHPKFPKLVRGYYFENGIPTLPSPIARNTELQEKLWNYSLMCVEGHVTEDLVLDLRLPTGNTSTN